MLSLWFFILAKIPSKVKKKIGFIVAHLKQDRAGSKKELGVFVVGDWHGCSNRCGFTGVKVFCCSVSSFLGIFYLICF